MNNQQGKIMYIHIYNVSSPVQEMNIEQLRILEYAYLFTGKSNWKYARILKSHKLCLTLYSTKMCYIFLILIQILSFNKVSKSLCCGVRLIEPQGASHSNNFAHLTLPRKEDLIALQLQMLISLHWTKPVTETLIC